MATQFKGSFSTYNNQFQADERLVLAIELAGECDECIRKGIKRIPVDPALITMLFPQANSLVLFAGEREGFISVRMDPAFLRNELINEYKLVKANRIQDLVSSKANQR